MMRRPGQPKKSDGGARGGGAEQFDRRIKWIQNNISISQNGFRSFEKYDDISDHR